MAANSNPKARENDLVVQELKDELMIYDLKTNKAFCLNETSARIWNLSDGTRSVFEISRELSKTYNKPVADDLVWLALDDLEKDNLLCADEKMTNNFSGMNRREVIRKVGIGSMIALPVISSLVAPLATMAASGGGGLNAGTFGTSTRAENQTCFDNTDCIQNVPFGSGCCTGANAPVSAGNPRVCRAANNGFNCT